MKVMITMIMMKMIMIIVVIIMATIPSSKHYGGNIKLNIVAASQKEKKKGEGIFITVS